MILRSPQLGSCKYRCTYTNRVVGTSHYLVEIFQYLVHYLVKIFQYLVHYTVETFQYLVHYLVETFFFFLSSFSTLPCEDFSLFSIFFFLFSFLRVHKKHQNANKRISNFSPLRCFLSAFLFAYLRFVFLLGCVLVLLVLFSAFWCVRNLFVKK